MKSSTIFGILITCVIVVFVSIVVLAIYDYNEAKEECSPLKVEKDCSYRICMAVEYSSNEMIDKAESCIIRELYSDVKVSRGEE